MMAAKLIKINLKNPIADFLALGFVQAVDRAVDGQRRKSLFVVIDGGFGVVIARRIGKEAGRSNGVSMIW